MYCLLCHEKIPRLRAWRTKSEFCSDEHAALYKKQTLDRLLTDQSSQHKKLPVASPLPEDDLVDLPGDETSAPPIWQAGRPPVADGSGSLDRDAGLPEVRDDEDAHDSVEELWRLADEVEHSDSTAATAREPARYGRDPEESEVPRQSAEEPPRALPMLAEEAQASKAARYDDPLNALSGEADFLADASDLGALADLPPLSDDLLAELNSDLSAFDDPAPLDENEPRAGERRPPTDRGSDDAPSILERLMEDPVSDWRGQPPKAAAAARTNDSAEEDPLADLAAMARGDEEPEIDPLAELIKAEESVKARADEEADGGDDAIDEAMAELLVDELADESLRDDLDLQELERNLKVLPFPSRGNASFKNGSKDYADRIAADADAALEANRLPAPDQPEPAVAATPAPPPRKPGKSEKPGWPSRTRTRFKPSMVMAGLEPTMQGYLQGDPVEEWRGAAVRSAWGETGSSAPHGFQVPAPTGAGVSAELRALRPEPGYRPQLGMRITPCTPAEAADAEIPTTSLASVQRPLAVEQPAEPTDRGAFAIRLSPEYRLYDRIAGVELQVSEGVDEALFTSLLESAMSPRPALAPDGLFYDSVAPEERYVDEEDWGEAADSPRNPSEGIDLSEDFANEQPAAQSSGSGGRRYR